MAMAMRMAPTVVVSLSRVGPGGALRTLDRAFFSSKRRERYGGERESRASDKAVEFARRAQRSQLDRLRAALALEAQHALPSLVPQQVAATDEQEEQTGLATEAAEGMKRDEAHARRLKAVKQARAQHLPLFKPGSALLRHFGERTLDSFAHLPITAFEGPVVVIHSPQEEALYASYLRAQQVVGVDTEAKPDFHTKKQTNPVCLVQVATLERAFVYRLQRGQPLPPVVQELFADPNVLKVGHSLQDDFRQLKRSKLVRAVNATVDTLPIADKLGCLRPGLKTLCQLFLDGNISKDMQVSNWEASRLSAAQIKYAATDAWAPLRVLLAMIQLEETRLLLRSKSYNSVGRTVVDNDHDTLLTRLHAFVIKQQQQQRAGA
ncbi:hypothetical protein PybrP1_001543 [[Pythium] brassicae (nom. inval.)]|nr:hypothetical protein PybrP1_001543 [[Pythium] brassicae (nom. inval.)]